MNYFLYYITCILLVLKKGNMNVVILVMYFVHFANKIVLKVRYVLEG